MNSIRTAWVAGVPLTAFGLLVQSSRAEDEAQRHVRRVDPMRQLTLPFQDLAFDESMRITEGPRGLEDAFPYRAAARWP